jgi:predicted flavoprotein YhiN
MNQNFDIIIVGGGAAGFFTAINMWRKSKIVCNLERGADVLQKLEFGGGRCNVTHACFEPNELVFTLVAKRTTRSFHQFCSGDTIEWFENMA